MKFKIVAHTDNGIRKGTNQDAVLLKAAQTDSGNIVFGAVCDGMGGLEKGELASAVMIRMLSQWFENSFPKLMGKNLRMEILRKSWNDLISQANFLMNSYGKKTQSKMGTTAVILLLAGNNYYIANVGDSRIYCLKKKITLLTKDQTFVQREIDLGRLSADEARKDVRKNILLQCVGASETVRPDYYTGTVKSGSLFLLCSDGFRHVIREDEMLRYLSPHKMTDEKMMKKGLLYLTELNKSRLETDNISAALIRVD